MRQKLGARGIATMGLLIAMMVVLTRFLAIETTFVRVSVTFIPEIIMGMLFGPFWSGIGGALADIVGMAVFPKAAYFFGFTVNAFIEGAIYGFFFYKKSITWKNAILANLTVTLIINLLLTPLWLALLYQVPLFSWVVWGPRLLKTAVWLPVQILVTYFIGSGVATQLIRNRNMQLK